MFVLHWLLHWFTTEAAKQLKYLNLVARSSLRAASSTTENLTSDTEGNTRVQMNISHCNCACDTKLFVCFTPTLLACGGHSVMSPHFLSQEGQCIRSILSSRRVHIHFANNCVWTVTTVLGFGSKSVWKKKRFKLFQSHKDPRKMNYFSLYATENPQIFLIYTKNSGSSLKLSADVKKCTQQIHPGSVILLSASPRLPKLPASPQEKLKIPKFDCVSIFCFVNSLISRCYIRTNLLLDRDWHIASCFTK